MACSKFEYVKHFEQNISLLKNTYIVVRIDGHAFHKFTHSHHYKKPNDLRGIELMNFSAKKVMEEFTDIFIGYGQSDEFSFVFDPKTTLYGRREAKIQTNLVSLFTSVFVREWNRYFPDEDLESYPSFDSRVVLYPSAKNLRDYLSWRQADCHINNLYNTAFWELVLNQGKTESEAEKCLRGTDSSWKNEFLFQSGINYNNIDQVYRKGSVLTREEVMAEEKSKSSGQSVKRKRNIVSIGHVDIIGDEFWNEHPRLL
jgi:tRNA(His) guanylyltransferase